MKATRKSFGEALKEMGEKYPQVICFDADLSKSTMSYMFAEKFPNRFFEMGIQEANMIGAAAGAAQVGKIPFICSFAAFLTGRFDQIRMSIGYTNANVKLIGTHAGVGIGEDGHSQMGLEDIALMRTIPGMTVLQPVTDLETKQMIQWAILHKGPVYLRLTRQAMPELKWPDTFSIKKLVQLRVGDQQCKHAFFVSGGPSDVAMQAAEKLAQAKILNPSVYNFSIIKPLPTHFLFDLVSSQELKTVTVFEDHSALAGAGGALAEWSSESLDRPLRIYRYGVRDIFGESGTPSDLYLKHGFTVDQIVKFHQSLPKPLK